MATKSLDIVINSLKDMALEGSKHETKNEICCVMAEAGPTLTIKLPE